jgi:hypothetical protein
MPSCSSLIDDAPVLDILAVMLYICFMEVNESIKNSTLDVTPVGSDKDELLAMLQNKILAVRCISYMFSVFRCVALILWYLLTLPLRALIGLALRLLGIQRGV